MNSTAQYSFKIDSIILLLVIFLAIHISTSQVADQCWNRSATTEFHSENYYLGKISNTVYEPFQLGQSVSAQTFETCGLLAETRHCRLLSAFEGGNCEEPPDRDFHHGSNLGLVRNPASRLQRALGHDCWPVFVISSLSNRNP